MYFNYVFAWVYKVMQVPVPIVLSSDLYSLVTIFDIFMFSVYIALFIILIRFIITDTLSFRVGTVSDFSYHVNSKTKENVSDVESVEAPKVYSNNSVGGRILNRKTLKDMKGGK